ncbi:MULTISPECIES: hypothetical protein [Lysobacter]|uniref:hypothetical protein n=1 Tax=Lysobacter TaxID=68 RepID=UPI001F3FC381|nr:MULTISPECIES: hypothetical protein [Lysobacter]UJB21449.1 hypothetical protein L1A79_10525 [Lysobacter capsici]UJQ29434.1 hypothetical protein L2D09_04340 [Lysobacter gummosus]
MNSALLVTSTKRATIRAPSIDIDLGQWLFTLTDQEYRACSTAHIAAGSSRTPEGKRVSINVEQPGDTLMVQHYVEDFSDRDRCRVVSRTDAMSPLGRTEWQVTWEVTTAPIDATTCEFTNHFHVEASDAFLALLKANGVPIDQASHAAQKVADQHNEEETPLFALDIERKARNGVWSR